MGLRKGQHNGGTFKPGFDKRRNPGGRVPGWRKDLQELCKVHTEEAVDILVEIAADRNNAPKDRADAAGMILAYGHGKPVDRVQVANMSGSSGVTDYRSLEKRLALKLERVLGASEAIDGTPNGLPVVKSDTSGDTPGVNRDIFDVGPPVEQ